MVSYFSIYTIDTSIGVEKYEENENLIKKIQIKLQEASKNLENLKEEVKRMYECFDNIANRISAVSVASDKVYQGFLNSPEVFNEYDTRYYNKISEFTKIWGKCYRGQIEFIKENMEEFYSFTSREYEAFSLMANDYFHSKRKYMEYRKELEEKKEKFYKLKNYDKWDLAPDDMIYRDTLELNKEECFEKMLRTETKKLNGLREKYIFLNNQIIKEHSKHQKFINKQLSKQNTEIIEKNKTLLADIFNLMKLATMSFI